MSLLESLKVRPTSKFFLFLLNRPQHVLLILVINSCKAGCTYNVGVILVYKVYKGEVLKRENTKHCYKGTHGPLQTKCR